MPSSPNAPAPPRPARPHAARVSRPIRRVAAPLLLLLLLTTATHAAPAAPAAPGLRGTARIVGGAPAGRHIARHVANLVIAHDGAGPESDTLCTATLISPQLLLTAAHCLKHPLSGRLAPDATRSFAHVGAQWAGPLRMGPRQRSARLFRVKEFRVLRGFRAWNPYDFRNDLAVVRLDRDVPPTIGMPLATARGPTDLPAAADGGATLAGYGTTRHGGPRPGKLKAARMLVKPYNVCLDREHPYYHQFMSKNAMLCAVPPGWPARARAGMCTGDSGGPLVAFDPKSKSLRLYGVASFATGRCASAGTAGWYVRVGGYAGPLNALLRGRPWAWRVV